MYILAIETTGAFASVALMKDDKIIGQIHGNDRFSHLQNLMPQVDTVIKESKLSLDDIDVIAVSRGPGSFTGIRIGVSSVRALSQALDIPCVEVSSLEALAMNAVGIFDKKDEISMSKSAFDDDVLVCPILDARRSQIYGGGYYIKNGYPEEEIKAGAYTIEEFLERVCDYHKILLFGDGADACRDKIKELRTEGTETAPENIRYQRAESAARLGAKLFAEKGGVPYNRVTPDYMRLAEAERRLKEKQKTKG